MSAYIQVNMGYIDCMHKDNTKIIWRTLEANISTPCRGKHVHLVRCYLKCVRLHCMAWNAVLPFYLVTMELDVHFSGGLQQLTLIASVTANVSS